jgi:predicted DNA-binding protein
MSVKLTVTVPDELRRRARAAAALRGETLSDVVRTSLEQYIEHVLEDADDARLAQEIRARIDSGETRTYSHQDIWSEIEDLEARGALPA